MINYVNINSDFNCVHCQNFVTTSEMLAGVRNRNHCPYCLWSRHLDHFDAGDRMSACKAPMKPVGLTQKKKKKKYISGTGGELMIVHLCIGCGKIAINRIAADDVSAAILEVFQLSWTLPSFIREKTRLNGITLLTDFNIELVHRQLFGKSCPPDFCICKNLLKSI